MAFFGPSSHLGGLVYYQTGGNPEIEPPPQVPPISSYSSLLWNYRHGTGVNGTKLNITLYRPSDDFSSAISAQCIVTSYEKDIMICETAVFTDPLVKIVPTDHWLHAMDTESYPHPQGISVRTQCKDVTCVNHYQKQKDYNFCLAYLPKPVS